ncbi:MAG: hypothetical protein L0Y71_09240 [Gemmataceae bacterium]|nr:hypothetical protein [Gemmataceae bacterium]
MSSTFLLAGAGRGLLCLLLALVVVLIAPGGTSLAAADGPVLWADASADPTGPLFASWLQDVIGNRTRLIQASFLFIIVGIFILWKK